MNKVFWYFLVMKTSVGNVEEFLALVMMVFEVFSDVLSVQIKCSANKDAYKHTCDECGLALSNSYSLHRHLKSQHREYYLRRKEERLRKKEEQALRKQQMENVSKFLFYGFIGHCVVVSLCTFGSPHALVGHDVQIKP